MIKSIAALISKTSNIAVLTGAGISAESGIPTFRDAQTGLWADFKPEELATPEAFARNPKLVWEWYDWRRQKLAEVQPNPGHFALSELSKKVQQLTLITQNVDGLHQRAGSENVIELHGSITRFQCHLTGQPIEPDWVQAQDNSPIPSPHSKNGFVRPSVVWFGEMLPEQAFQQAITAAGQADLFFSIGTSAMVEPAASLARLAKSNGATVIEINPSRTPLTPDADYFLQQPSGVVLPKIIEQI